jgi:L-ascorbate metabolism protein UlaG (beta-lactamase superfamily)
MEITWYGHSCFRVTERGMPTVVSDPYDHASAGFSALKLKGDIVTVSHDAAGHNFVKGVKGTTWDLRGPGEYEIGGVFITGVATNEGKTGEKNVAFVMDYEGVTVGHLGDMQSVPSRSQVEAFGTVDVLLVPVGGGNALTAAKAAEVIALIEPGIVVPMHYKVEGSKVKLNPLKQFLQEMGLTKEKAEESLKVTSSSIPEETQVVVLKAAQ